MTIQYFIKIQEDRINEVRTHLHQEWQKEVVDIYTEELGTMKKSKRNAYLFFEANATLMSNLLRSLINDSLVQYNQFFQRFDKRNDVLRTPEQIVQSDELESPIEDVFLVVKLKYEQNKIEFADNLFQLIKPELLRLIEEIQKCSMNFPRPENNIARSEKQNLWILPTDDENYQKVYQNIDSILDQNLNNVLESLEIYEQYSYLLKESEKTQVWSQQPHSRNDYIQEFQKYNSLYVEVN